MTTKQPHDWILERAEFDDGYLLKRTKEIWPAWDRLTSSERVIVGIEHDRLLSLIKLQNDVIGELIDALDLIAATDKSSSVPDFKWLQDWRHDTKQSAKVILASITQKLEEGER